MKNDDDDTVPNELTINRFLIQLANKIGANVITLCEGPAVNNKINKIAVVESSMNRTYLCVGWWKRRNICPNCWKICDKREWQPWIVAVYRLLKRKMYCKYLNNIQCEGPAVQCRFWSLQHRMYAKYVNNQQREGPTVNKNINKIVVVKSSMNHTYLCVNWWRRRNVRPYFWKKRDKIKQQRWILAVY